MIVGEHSYHSQIPIGSFIDHFVCSRYDFFCAYRNEETRWTTSERAPTDPAGRGLATANEFPDHQTVDLQKEDSQHKNSRWAPPDPTAGSRQATLQNAR